jgi:hypothetical protein
MYMTFRNMQAHMAHMADAVGVAVAARDHLNDHYGTNYAVSVNIGGDPSAISMTCPWGKLGDYDKVRTAIAGDARMQSLLRMGGAMLTSVQDTIGQILKAPGERGAFASVSVASMHMPAVAQAVPFAIEVAEYAEQKTGRTVGVMAAKTGNRSGIMWATFAESLDQIMDDSQALETDPNWLEFFRRSEGLYVPGSLEDSIWQFMP